MNKVWKVPIGGLIGIIGGGQLGRMLSISASQLGFKTHIFDPDPEAPAKQVTNTSSTFPYDDKAALEKFSDSVDVVTFEFENIPKETIKICQRFSTVFPDAESLSTCQDRINEKKFLRKINIPASPFMSSPTVSKILQSGSILKFPLVLKSSRFGYDGKGQRIISSEKDLKNSEPNFKNLPVILEDFIDFKLEISVIICRDIFGKIAAYDPIENIHQNGILVESKVPANISFSLASDAILIASKIVNSLEYVGVMGVEFFVTKEDQLLVNELAPRVHNSGHWTQSGCLINQFEQHIRAITGWPIGNGKRHSDVIMRNVLGSDIEGLENKSDSSVTIYGKNDPRDGRKMGHINYTY
ncbi:MAG: 5-(carboxyamino)imidazole ribonucleotide synthase [Rhodobacteraceae bacterium]|nr:5-(carboxyamino)imidazole ribonucleotide synthase [Paracoccaceae bacterium]